MFTKQIALFTLLAATVVAAPVASEEQALEARHGKWRGNSKGYHGHKWNGKGRGKGRNGKQQAATTEESASTQESTVSDDSAAKQDSSNQEETPAAAAPASSASHSGEQFSGIASFYSVVNPAENHGYAPGTVSCSDQLYSNSDLIVAMNDGQYDSSSPCGKKVLITDKSTGNSQEATVVDRCAGCAWGQLDLTEGLWNALHNGKTSDGLFDITWSYI